VSDLSDNAKEGYLLRQEGKMRKTWRSRFVVLAGDILYIFSSSQVCVYLILIIININININYIIG
jgi:hypothetical protein